MATGKENIELKSNVDIYMRDDVERNSRVVDIVINLDWKDVFAIWEEALTSGNKGNVKIRAQKKIPYALVNDKWFQLPARL